MKFWVQYKWAENGPGSRDYNVLGRSCTISLLIMRFQPNNMSLPVRVVLLCAETTVVQCPGNMSSLFTIDRPPCFTDWMIM
jgi:hypothetical protein